MGKALLVIVLGSSVVLASQLFSSVDGEKKTARDERGYQEEVIAREIAQSAFNVGMGEIRSHGNSVLIGARALNGPDNAGRAGTYDTGRFAGGSYTIRAEPTSGHSAQIVATGTYGGATVTMHDEHSVPVMEAPKAGGFEVEFVKSEAGYCSAVYYVAYTRDLAEGEVPTPQLLFDLDNRHDKKPDPVRYIQVQPGTVMNFFIAVKKGAGCELQKKVGCEARDVEFDPTKYDHVHYALDVEAGSLDQAKESIWALVEAGPPGSNEWRIGWEDLHYPQWDDRDSDDPEQSFQALKRLGYDGLGWMVDPADGYYVDLGDEWLRDGKINDGQSTSYRPDFSDQVIKVRFVPASGSSATKFVKGHQEPERADQQVCGEPVDQPVLDPGTLEPATPDPATTPPDDELTDYACKCTSNGANDKYPILHRPPGNESNEQLLCLPQPAIVNAHMENHNDVLLSCNASRTIRSNNKNKNK